MKLRKILGFSVVALALMYSASLQAARSKSQDVLVPYEGTVAGTHLAKGQYSVKCETDGTSAKLVFLQDRKVIATVEGQLADRSGKYSSNEVIYDKKPDGSRTIVEIRFARPSQVIVFKE